MIIQSYDVSLTHIWQFKVKKISILKLELDNYEEQNL